MEDETVSGMDQWLGRTDDKAAAPDPRLCQHHTRLPHPPAPLVELLCSTIPAKACLQCPQGITVALPDARWHMSGISLKTGQSRGGVAGGGHRHTWVDRTGPRRPRGVGRMPQEVGAVPEVTGQKSSERRRTKPVARRGGAPGRGDAPGRGGGT